MTKDGIAATFLDALACGQAGCTCARAVRQRRGYTHCPAHDDSRPSLSVTEKDGQILFRCRAGCSQESVIFALSERGLWSKRKEKGGLHIPPRNSANLHTSGLTVAQYAAAKKLPEEFLRRLGLTDMHLQGVPAVRIPYPDPDGSEASVRFRLALDGDRFRWKSGSKVMPYGRDRLTAARDRGEITLVEGESDCHTLWLHDEPAEGFPGASTWQDPWAADLEGIPIIHLVQEPGGAGEALVARLAALPLRGRVRVITEATLMAKDVSALYLDDPARFKERWAAAKAAAEPLVGILRRESEACHRAAAEAAGPLTLKTNILDLVEQAVEQLGLVGEARNAKLLFLIMVTRFLDRPVSAVIKGVSSSGKSFLVDMVLRLFPEAAFYKLSAMSDRAMAYSEESLKHRFLVIYEAAGLNSDFASYLVRSLLSEGRVRYETVEKTKDGLRPRLIEREGPTGLIVTTTQVKLNPENETRLLTLATRDTPEQTGQILRALAKGKPLDLDLCPWHALQEWLTGAEHRVVIPFAEALAEKIPPVAVRLRRDFGAVLALIGGHAILHQSNRPRDPDGRIIASLVDYAPVRELLAELVAEGAGKTVSSAIRETVAAVRELTDRGTSEATVTAVERELKLDYSAAYRRVQVALDRGYLRNQEDRPRRPARLVLGDPLPEEQVILPAPEGMQVCTVAGEDSSTPSPSIHHPDGSGVPDFWDDANFQTLIAAGIPEAEDE